MARMTISAGDMPVAELEDCLMKAVRGVRMSLDGDDLRDPEMREAYTEHRALFEQAFDAMIDEIENAGRGAE